jgi:hypothetical protein
MEINLNENEIQQALVQYINNKGIDLSQSKTNVTLIAGRGANGHSAVVSITEPAKQTGEAVVEGPSPDPNEEQQAISFDFKNPDDDD